MNTKHLKLRWVIILLLFCSHLFAQNIRGLHVNDFKYILGDEEKENQLLGFAQSQGFNYLLLYNLGHIHRHLYDLRTSQGAAVLANFIEKAKQQYDIQQIGAVGEKYTSFLPYFNYNGRYAGLPLRQIDVFSIEFEFWNRNLYGSGEYYCTTYLQEANLPCTQEGAFTYFESQLEKLEDLLTGTDILIECYIGKPSKTQCTRIAELCDRVLVHYYRQSDTYQDGRSIYNYQSYRLPALAAAGKEIDILPIFNSRPQFMGDWLSENEPEQTFATFLFGLEGFNQQQGDWKRYIHIQGYQWYRYTNLYEAVGPGELPFTLTNNKNLIRELVDIQAYPNPVIEDLHLRWESEIRAIRIRVFSRSGQNIYSNDLTGLDHLLVNAAGFPKGMLLIVIDTEQGTLRKKILCQ